MTDKKPDAGVFDQTTGKWMTRVAAKPQAGQYVFDEERGYTFAAADEGHVMLFVNDPPPLTVPLTAEEIAEERENLRENGGDDAVGLPTNRLERLLDEVERSRALLKRIEWDGFGADAYGEGGGFCPSCKGDHQHRPGCELAALLGVVR